MPWSGRLMDVQLLATWALVGSSIFALLFFAVGVFCTLRQRGKGPVPPAKSWPALSLLKPIKGVEESMEANLRTFFEQAYAGPFEIVFSSTERDDPGIALAKTVAADYPHIESRFVGSDPNFGLNPKVANLAGAMAAAEHDLVLQSDANVRIRPGYLNGVVSEYLATGANLLTSMVVGVGERSSGAAMENLQLTAFITPAMCVARELANINCVVGKSMLLSRSELMETGGLQQVRDVLAEDFILGRRYERLGKKVVLSSRVVENVNVDIGVEAFLARHCRWLKMRATIHLLGFFADLFANPVALAVFAVLVSGFEPWVVALLAAIVPAKALADLYLVRLCRGHSISWRHLLLAPIKDALMGFGWLYSTFSRSVNWRGKRLRFGRNSLLRPDEGALPVRLFRAGLGRVRFQKVQ